MGGRDIQRREHTMKMLLTVTPTQRRLAMLALLSFIAMC